MSNILKPIQDALVGLVFFDDAIVTDAIAVGGNSEALLISVERHPCS
jgi:hypothetical protein